jgi:hypothetical protein
MAATCIDDVREGSRTSIALNPEKPAAINMSLLGRKYKSEFLDSSNLSLIAVLGVLLMVAGLLSYGSLVTAGPVSVQQNHATPRSPASSVTNLGAEVTTSPYSVSLNMTSASHGSHTLTARARNAAGNSGTSTSVTVTVDNQAPTGTVVINNGAAATNSTAVTLNLSAVDSEGAVTQMRFSNNGATFNTAVAYATTASWTLTKGAGTKTVFAQFKDAAGNWSAAATDTIVLDTTAPTVTNRTATNLTRNSATITWTTNEPADSQVEYGPTKRYGVTTTLDSNLVLSHSVPISGLNPSTLYHYRVRSRDAAGNLTVSADSTFTTGSVADTTPPSTPTNLSATPISSTQINLQWTASTDNVAVTGYKVFRGGA